MASIEKGSKVEVFEDPITCTKREGIGTVTKVLRVEDWSDVDGNPITRCNVRFKADQWGGNGGVFERDVSRIAG